MRPTEYFLDGEVTCHCGCDLKPTQNALDRLNAVRVILGIPLVISSGARCKEYNKQVGGAVRSKHLLGEAFDIILTTRLQKSKIEFFQICRVVGFMGFGYGRTFIHIDCSTRSKVTEWTYK